MTKSNQSSKQEQTNDNKKTVVIDGLTMQVNATMSLEDLKLSEDELKSKLKNHAPNLFLIEANQSNLITYGLSEETPLISSDTLFSMSTKIVNSYPSFVVRNKDDFYKIKKDFYTLTDEEISKNIEKIRSCYIKQIRVELTDKLITYSKTSDFQLYRKNTVNSLLLKSKQSIKLNSYSILGMTVAEWWMVYSYPHLIFAIDNARNRAYNASDSYTYSYGLIRNAPNKSDALRHYLWNQFMVKDFMGWGYNVNDAINIARGFSSAHEYGTNLNVRPSLQTDDIMATAMDYNNNKVGLNNLNVYWVSTWWFFGYWAIPSDQDLINDGISRLNYARYVTMGNYNLGSSWDRIFSNDNSTLVYIQHN